jgi:hypothetical protein
MNSENFSNERQSAPTGAQEHEKQSEAERPLGDAPCCAFFIPAGVADYPSWVQAGLVVLILWFGWVLVMHFPWPWRVDTPESVRRDTLVTAGTAIVIALVSLASPYLKTLRNRSGAQPPQSQYLTTPNVEQPCREQSAPDASAHQSDAIQSFQASPAEPSQQEAPSSEGPAVGTAQSGIEARNP